MLKANALFSRKYATFAHKAQMKYDWGTSPIPEWHDHFCDQYFQFRAYQTPYWMERGIFGNLAMKQGANVMEMCCGDGFNAHHFYSPRASKVVAIDFDETAIAHAKKYNQADNIDFQLCDIRYAMPQGVFNNIIWDAAIEHFTEAEIEDIMKNIKSRLTPDGILTGYTLCEKEDGLKALVHHEYEFKSKEDLQRFFEPHFKNVKVFETIYPSKFHEFSPRHNLYFYASDSVLPFDNEWPSMTTAKR